MSAGEGAEPDCADRDPGEPFHLQMKVSRHPADFAVFAFTEDKVVMPRAPGGADCSGFEDVACIRDPRTRELPDSVG